jgi:hypothetical protein
MQVTAHVALKAKTQHALRMLQQHPEGLTSNEARRLGCGDRFAARVDELRAAFGDEAIPDKWESVGKVRFKRYRWVEPGPAQRSLEI